MAGARWVQRARFWTVERALKIYLPTGQFENVPAMRSRTMGAIRGKNTKTTEVALRMILVRAQVRGWTLHARHLPGKPDVFFRRQKVAVFVDGCFWHGCPRCGHVPKTRSAFWRAKLERNRKRDHRVTKALRKSGFKVVRLWEHLLKSDSGMRTALMMIRRARSSKDIF